VDKARLQDLDEAVRKYLAWQSILSEKEALNLDPHQVRQAEMQRTSADGTVAGRLPETYQWLLVPTQASPQAPMEWQAMRLTGQDALAVRASTKFRKDELLLTGLGATRLRMELDRVPLWRGDHVTIQQLVADFARYPYLPRLAGPAVLVKAVCEGVALLTWSLDSFAFAEGLDDSAGRYRGLRGGQNVSIPGEDPPGLVVKPDVARRQLDAEVPPPRDKTEGREADASGGETLETRTPPPSKVEAPRPRRFHGTVELDPTRVGRDASRVAEEVIGHLAAPVGARLKVTLEIEAEIPDGAPDHLVRIVTENSRALKFSSHGFEDE
jgi:hypothetical protein